MESADNLRREMVPVAIEDEMRRSYLDYSMSVIIGRALPDVRDGLKPVHRRILFAMHEEGMLHNKRYSKCAGVVGEVLKKYHPHGDAAVYDALVRLAQPWNVRYPLIDGQGNFGSVDGDPAAAYRYTESRLTRLSSFLLDDLDKETVDFAPNFDGSTHEPLVLPTRFPNLLVNGAAGIAVGMATNIPPHNMAEVIESCCWLVDHPEARLRELLDPSLGGTLPGGIRGPDFPTAAFVHGKEGVLAMYETGRGSIRMRARHEVEVNEKTGREAIIITEIPYQVNKAKLVERIAQLVHEKKLEGISDLRDESDRHGMRVVIELKKDAVAGVVLNNLWAHSQLQDTFGAQMLAIDGGQPRTLSLRQMLERFIAHRREVVARRCRFLLGKAKEREHLLLGLAIALDHIDEIIALIKASGDRGEAQQKLMTTYGLSERQSKAILDMQLARLTGLEREKIALELAEVQAEIARLTAILASEPLLLSLVKDELYEVKKQFGDPRRTEIVGDAADLSLEDLIAEEDMVVTVSHAGYVKRNPVSLYREQRRGGRGVTGAQSAEDDFVEQLFVASTHAYLLVFTDRGRVHWLKVHELPQAGRAAKGKAIVNLVQLAPGEKVAEILPVKELKSIQNDDAIEGGEVAERVQGPYVVFATRQGLVKRTPLSAYGNPRGAGIVALSIEEGDALVAARLAEGSEDLLLGTARGMSIRFQVSEVRPMGRGAYGVKGITLDPGDEVVGAELAREGSQLLTITENGYGKRTAIAEYRLTHRGGKGVIDIKTTERNGKVAAIVQVTDGDGLMLITNRGMTIRTRAAGVSQIGRNTQGVRLIQLAEGDKVVSVARLPVDEAESEEGGPAGEPRPA